MANQFYTNNFRGRAGRRERAKHLVDEFKAIEDAFTELQAYNIANYLTIYVNTLQQSGSITIYPDNGYLQELTLTANITIQLAPPTSENHYRMSLLIHGASYTVTNGWGEQTWKEYGNPNDNWYELFTAEGPYASMLLDFFWDICTSTWICVASSKNITNTAGGRVAETRFYPLLCNLTNIEGDDTWVLDRNSNGQTIDQYQQYHYLPADIPRYHGVRWVENWCPTASDLTSVAWKSTDCTVTTDVGAGPAGEDVQRLSFDVTGGKHACYILPSFGRASTFGDPIRVTLSFMAYSPDVTTTGLRVSAALMGKTNQSPPVHDIWSLTVYQSEWNRHVVNFNIFKDGNDPKSMALDQLDPKCLLEIAFMSRSGGAGQDVLITDVQIEVHRQETDLTTVGEIQDTTIGTSIALSGTGTGAWSDGTKTLTLAIPGQYIDLSGTLEAGKTYLVDARLQAGDAADIRMQNEVTVWGAGTPADALYVQDAPFTFQYDGGQLKFVLTQGISSVYLVDIYEVSNERSAYCTTPTKVVGPKTLVLDQTGVPYDTGILLGTAREIQSENLIPYQYFRTFTSWDQVGLSGVEANDCRSPVFQSEYGIDGWPSRATILQGASRATDGYITRTFNITPAADGFDIQFFVRRTLDSEGNLVYTPQNNDVTVPVSRYVDFEAELSGGGTTIESGRIRLDLQTNTFVGQPSGYNYQLGVFLWDNWLHCVIGLTNDGTHDTFTVRVYPASADDPDPSVIDVTQQGWCVIDWCQFEQQGGTFGASSPMIGGYTRATENFTTALPDGEIFGTYVDGSFLDVPDKKVADVTAGDIIWQTDDYVWRNLLYSTTGFGTVASVNMHEFGLVEGGVQPPQNDLQIVTTTPYAIYTAGAATASISINEMRLDDIPHDTASLEMEPLGGALVTKLLTGPTLEDTGSLAMAPTGGALVTKLLTGPTLPDTASLAMAPLGGTLENKLVTANAPAEGADTALTLNESGWSLDPV